MRSHASFEPIVTKFCMWGLVVDVITGAKYYETRLRGFGVTVPPPKAISYSLLNVHRPYNSVSTTGVWTRRDERRKSIRLMQTSRLNVGRR